MSCLHTCRWKRAHCVAQDSPSLSPGPDTHWSLVQQSVLGLTSLLQGTPSGLPQPGPSCFLPGLLGAISSQGSRWGLLSPLSLSPWNPEPGTSLDSKNFQIRIFGTGEKEEREPC